MNGSDEASPRPGGPGRDFPILARDLIFAFFSQGGPRVRILLPPAESQSLAGLCRRGPRTPAFCAGVPGAFPARSAETRGARRHRANPQKYLSQAIFQYRISGDAVVTSCRAKASRLSPSQIGLPLGSGMLVDLARSGGSSEAEHGPLIVPTERQTGVL